MATTAPNTAPSAEIRLEAAPLVDEFVGADSATGGSVGGDISGTEESSAVGEAKGDKLKEGDKLVEGDKEPMLSVLKTASMPWRIPLLASIFLSTTMASLIVITSSSMVTIIVYPLMLDTVAPSDKTTEGRTLPTM